MILIQSKNDAELHRFFIYEEEIHKVCHFDGGEISIRNSTKIELSMWSYLRRFLLRRNDKIVVILRAKEILVINFDYFQCSSRAKQVFSSFVMLNVAVVWSSSSLS